MGDEETTKVKNPETTMTASPVNGVEWEVVGSKAKKKGKEAIMRFVEEGEWVSFYVTNLPNRCRREWLADAVKDVSQGLGVLADTFISSKPNKARNIFGFIKFSDVKNKWDLERRLKGVTVGVMKAKVNLQKFDRQGKPVESEVQNSVQSVKAEDSRSVGLAEGSRSEDGWTGRAAQGGAGRGAGGDWSADGSSVVRMS
ncbi:hypothetical protein SSX86_010203 [Deinandra increscens subsp. villosa]|uniref:RRM domain-containing protein n=1 Tax=Deinandra increscens subsp. villosa TaxID=3103831 RepID=A0AAP0H302_9ASTR